MHILVLKYGKNRTLTWNILVLTYILLLVYEKNNEVTVQVHQKITKFTVQVIVGHAHPCTEVRKK